MTVNIREIVELNIDETKSKISQEVSRLEQYCEIRQKYGVLLTVFAPNKLIDDDLNDKFEENDKLIKKTQFNIDHLNNQLSALQEFYKTFESQDSYNAAIKEIERIYPMPMPLPPKNDGLLW